VVFAGTARLLAAACGRRAAAAVTFLAFLPTGALMVIFIR